MQQWHGDVVQAETEIVRGPSFGRLSVCSMPGRLVIFKDSMVGNSEGIEGLRHK